MIFLDVYIHVCAFQQIEESALVKYHYIKDGDLSTSFAGCHFNDRYKIYAIVCIIFFLVSKGFHHKNGMTREITKI